ncbi:shikimate O-hydroxycinnamoyltransferase-like [Macadamia integrifolia]|uniref:shikimate O-hydroxycinnamoyltransferase-like n=1 Tax=Macadamia integrifolia TaxID=60698 RepID=UPI001C5016FE|nr:shikimate O-hydroxycinnamoyltransferase-like [Macadamia integrifolia]
MGTHHQEPPSIIQDLKVTLQYSLTVFPLEETKRRSMFISNIDQVLNFNVETVHFFPANPDFPPDIVAEKIKTTLRKLLVTPDFLAGRLRLNPQKSRLEIDCNAAGAGFVVATSEVSLDEIGDLVYPNPAFRQLIMGNPDNLAPDNQPLCSVQVTSFKCGSFTIGISTNHVTFDGISFKHFLENLASLAADKPLAVTPCNNRELLTARSPPRVMFPHPELVNFEIPPQREVSNAPTLFEATPEDLEFKIFRLSAKDISDLKEKAKLGLNNNTSTRISGFNVVTAVWRCTALVGTTCATVLTRAIFSEGCKSVAAGMNAMDLCHGITMAVDAVVTNLKSRARMISTIEEIAQVYFFHPLVLLQLLEVKGCNEPLWATVIVFFFYSAADLILLATVLSLGKKKSLTMIHALISSRSFGHSQFTSAIYFLYINKVKYFVVIMNYVEIGIFGSST